MVLASDPHLKALTSEPGQGFFRFTPLDDSPPNYCLLRI